LFLILILALQPLVREVWYVKKVLMMQADMALAQQVSIAHVQILLEFPVLLDITALREEIRSQ
jgi:hypothetical protein